MKRFKLLYLIPAVLMFVSCLDENPEYSVNRETTFEDINTAELALKGCYGYLTTYDSYGQAMQELMTGASGLSWTQTSGNDQDRFASFDASVSCTITGMAWKGLYQTINACNLFIENIYNGPLPEVNKTYMVAQARFLRGFCYYNLVHIFGGVPLRLAAPEATEVNMGRATKAEIVEQVIADMNFAAANLQPKENDRSIPTRYAAYAYLAKLYFMLGSSDSEQPSSYWQMAKAAGDSVFIKGGYALEGNFATLFQPATKISVESIFQLNFSVTSATTGNRGSWLFAPQNAVPGKSWARIRASKAFHDYFKGTNLDDPRYETTFMSSWKDVNTGEMKYSYPIISWKEGRKTYYDTIPYKTLTTPINPAIEELSKRLQNAFLGRKGEHNGWAHYRKPIDFEQAPQNSHKNLIVYRYADFLLLMADTYNELNDQTMALALLNTVRFRARNSAVPMAKTPANLEVGSVTKEELRKIIFDERCFELAGEPEMYIDVRRRGTEYLKVIVERNNNHHLTHDFAVSDTVGVHNFKERLILGGNVTEDLLRKNLLLPVPQNELNGNESISVKDQNYGY